MLQDTKSTPSFCDYNPTPLLCHTRPLIRHFAALHLSPGSTVNLLFYAPSFQTSKQFPSELAKVIYHSCHESLYHILITHPVRQ